MTESAGKLSSAQFMMKTVKIGFPAPCFFFFEFCDFDKILKISTHIKLHHKNASTKLRDETLKKGNQQPQKTTWARLHW